MTKPILEVWWLDAVTHPGWQGNAEKLELILNVTVGVLVNEDKEVIRIAGTMGSDGEPADVSVIPLSLVKSKKKIGQI